MLSSVGNYQMEKVFEALEHGAYDYLNKPKDNQTKIKSIADSLIQKVKNAANADIKTLARGLVKSNQNPHTFNEVRPYDIIVIGASTGGPSAVQTVLTRMPTNLNLPVIIVQHMPQNFIPAFTKRLDVLLHMPVVQVVNNMPVESGKVYVLSTDQNTKLMESKGQIKFIKDRNNYSAYNDPSIDGVMASINKVFGKRTIGVLLTGMGKDGAMGMQEIHKTGGLTIAQDEESSVVFGMPKAAILQGGVSAIMDVKDISGYIVSSLS